MRPELKRLIITEAEKFYARLADAELELLDRYLALIRKYNEKLNLTGIADERGIVVKLFIDSLSAHRYLKDGWLVLDLGSGMGCPGIVLKVARPSLSMILVESNRRKSAFINQAIRALSLADCRSAPERAEDKTFRESLAGRVDAVLARALGKLDLLCRLSGPYLKSKGRLIAYKGPEADQELSRAKAAIDSSGFAEPEIFRYKLPFGEGERALVVLKKI